MQCWPQPISKKLTLFCLIIYLFKIDIHSSLIQGFIIIFSQILTIPAHIRVTLLVFRNRPKMLQVIKVLATFFGIWNLDFFRACDQHICLGLRSLSNLFLDLAVAVYPLILVALTYVLIFLYDRNYKILILAWKPFHFFLGRFYQKLWVKTSVLNSITTSLFLVNLKVLSVCFDALTPVRVYPVLQLWVYRH